MDDPIFDMVRTYDPERFLCALFAPEPRRSDLMAALAFNIEIAGIREKVSEPLIGEMRLQFWRDGIDDLTRGEVRNHEVLQALASGVACGRLHAADFHALIDARARDLDPTPMADLAELETYARATTDPLVRLSAAALTVSGQDDLKAARETGTAWALMGLLRAVPFHRAQGVRVLPRTRSKGAEAEQARAVADRVAARLAAARGFRTRVAKESLPLLLPALLLDGRLADLRRAGYDLDDRRLGRRLGPGRQVRLILHAAFGKY